MKWLLKKTDGRGPAVYVAPRGSRKSYCLPQNAQEWDTKEAAEANACGNEIAVQVRNADMPFRYPENV